MIKNTDTQLAFVCSADPGIYSSIVSDLKNLQLLPIDDESWGEVFLLFVEKWSHHMSYDKELKENVMKFLSYVKIILLKLADNVRQIYFAQLGITRPTSVLGSLSQPLQHSQTGQANISLFASIAK